MSPDRNHIDDRLRRAADDVRLGLGDVEPPPFEPPSPSGSRLALVAAVAALVIGGWWLTRPGSEPSPVDVAVDDSVTTSLEPTGDDMTESATDEPPGVIDAGITSSEEVPTTPMDRPDLDAVATEPDFGSTIRRLTDSPARSVTQPVFARTQTFNADGSLMLLYRTGEGVDPGHVVVDGETGALVAELDLAGRSDIENVSWDPLDANTLIFQRDNTLVDVDVLSGEEGARAEFSGCATIDSGTSPGSFVSSTGVAGFLCELTTGGTQWLGFDRTSNTTIVGELATVDAAPIPSTSGDYFVVPGDQQLLVFDAALDPVRIVEIEASSFTMAQDRSGHDVVVATVFGGPTAEGTAVLVDLETGDTRVLVGPDTGYPYPPSGTQLSTASTDAPFRVAIVTNVVDDSGVLVNEIMLLDLDGADSTLSRLAHHRNDGLPVGDWPSTSMVGLDPSGSRIVFSSNWGTGAIDTFVIELDR